MREKVIAGNVYHILNRGVDKRNIFLKENDYLRFIHDLFEFNDAQPINNITYSFKNKVIARPYIKGKRPRKLLVEILAFCLMPNHYHLLLRPRFDNSITKFMKRLNMGYARYFNEKYKRSGALFEGRYKLISVKKESHYIHLPYYIHFNPLDLFAPEWRERKLRDYKKAIQFLESYRWSSHPDYLGKTNFPSLTQRETLLEIFGSFEKYENSIKGWLKDLNLENIKNIALE